MKKDNKFIQMLEKLEEIILVTMFIAMVLIIFIQVIMRYAFNSSLSWSEELGKFLFVWLSWLGISIGAKRGEHIKITMFLEKLSEKKLHIINIVSEIIVLSICAVTAFYGIKLVISEQNVFYAGIKISMSWGYLAVVVGCIMMMIRSIYFILISAKNIREIKNEGSV